MTLPPIILLIEYCFPAFHLLDTLTHIIILHMYKKKVLFIYSDAKISVVMEYYLV